MYNISLITGDGIGPELSESVKTILNTIHDKLNIKFEIKSLVAGDVALENTGKALPDDVFESIKSSDACMKAPVGESAIDDIDLVIVRENTEDLYTGQEFQVDDTAVALRIISEKASKRIAKHAFETAIDRNQQKRVTCVHKSNVMKITDGLFARACDDISKNYPDVTFDQMYVDACSMNLIRSPHEFDVIVTTNLFGDILSDESSQVVGGLGMAPAAYLGDNFGLFEPVHGAAFDIAGKQIANPSSFILSTKMMLDWLGSKNNDVGCISAGKKLEDIVLDLIKSGITTKDIGGEKSTQEFTKEITSRF